MTTLGPARSNKLSLVMASYMKKPSLVLQAFDKVGDDAYSLIFSSTLPDRFGFDDYNTALNELTDNHFSILSHSLLRMDDDKGLFRCIVRGNNESRPFTEESTKGWTCVRANIFMDESDKVIWKLEGDGDNKRLVRQSPQDFETLLETKRTRDPILSSETISPYEVGDYAYFFNHQIAAMDYGYVVDRDGKDYVFSRSRERLVELTSPMQVLIAHAPTKRDGDKQPLLKKREMLSASEYSMDGYLEYLAALYGKDSEYYKAVERNIREYMTRG